MVARQLLSEFAAKRPEDRFGMIVFSTLPMRVLEFTQKSEVIQAAITAGNIGRGLSETNIGLALQSALATSRTGPTPARASSCWSPTAATGSTPTRASASRELAHKYRVAIYWIYIRSANSPGLTADQAEPPSECRRVPEYFLHRFFQSLGTPYRAYEAGNPEALQQAIDDVNRLENLPITYHRHGAAARPVALASTAPRSAACCCCSAPACWRSGDGPSHAHAHAGRARAAGAGGCSAAPSTACALWRAERWNALIASGQPSPTAPASAELPAELRFAQAAGAGRERRGARGR